MALERVMAKVRTRFLTLTQRVIPGESCEAGRRRLLRSWAAFWRAAKRAGDPRLRGGLRTVEVTWSRADGWHWHLHVLCEGAYYPQDALSRDWQAAGGDEVVWIKAVSDVNEVVKYSLKVASLPPDRIVEYAAVSRGWREHQTFGSWYRMDRSVPDDPAEASDPAVLVPAAAVDALAVESPVSGPAPTPAEEDAVLRVHAAFERGGLLCPPRSIAEWRLWARRVRRGWLADAEDARAGCERRAAGRARRRQGEWRRSLVRTSGACAGRPRH